MKYFVVEFEDEYFLVEEPSEDDIILHETDSLFEAETMLCRECSAAD